MFKFVGRCLVSDVLISKDIRDEVLKNVPDVSREKLLFKLGKEITCSHDQASVAEKYFNFVKKYMNSGILFL